MCPVHVSVRFTPGHVVPYDDGIALRNLLVLCGRDYEDEFYSLVNDQAQIIVDLLEEVLRYPSIDAATYARLLRYIIRLSRKSGRLPCQLLLNIGPLQMNLRANGGSAVIYTASYNNRFVAIKRSHLPRLNECRKQFVSEAVIWSHLKHENIVPFIGVIEKDHGLWLVSEWMHKGNVRAYIESVGRGSCDLRNLAEGTAKGLSYLHALNPPIVHGDLKGYNILVDFHENACLADFGISHTDDSRPWLDSSKVGRQDAALNWIAPEIILGNAERLRMTLETDMYAFGCVVYEIYTGNTPFDKENVIKCLEQMKRPSLRGLEEPIKKLIGECWQDKPKERTKARDAVKALRNMKKSQFLSSIGF
ncbi:kinase-like protein [Rhizopogon vinicolor AM-OR11-026]|uniref:Kinase-like protein n=1 Tax=Rhizopogon vinicolor AM-OR11-026 TaxID=1314800 RepID=A0A1B7NIN8_9AGAM|nr:kinase-like protein [Rhizopogon vinicolor AM-OR11-026]